MPVRKRIAFGVTFSVAALISLHHASFAQAVTEIKVGSVWSISGAASALGLPGAQGVRLAVDEINKQGFKAGDKLYKLRLVEFDTKSDPNTALSGINKLVERDQISVLFGDTAGTTTKPMIDVTQRAKIPHFSPAVIVQMTILETPDKVPFLINSNNPYAGDNGVLTALGKNAFEKFGIKTAILVQQDEASSRVMGPLFKKAFEAAGGKVLAEEYLPTSTTDFSAVISRLKATNPDALFFGYSDPWMVPFATQARQADLAKWYIGAPGTSTAPAIKSGKTPLENFLYATPIVGLTDSRKGMVDYLKRYEAFNGTKSSAQDAFSMLSYPWVYAYVEAVKRAGGIDPDRVMANLRKNSFEFPDGPLPTIRISAIGLGSASFDICSLTQTPPCTRIDP
jgi:branched-chain amino acid transport system substrate-binding protein